MINKRIWKTGALAVALTVVFAIFAFRAADWTKGLNSEFLAYGASASGGGTTTGGGGGTSGATTSVAVPQIAVGEFPNSGTTYGTVIEITNPNNSAITISGNFYNIDGTPSTLTFKTNISTTPTVTGSFTNLSVPAYGILVLTVGITADTTPATGTTSWGLISGTNPITVATFFELRRKSDSLLYSRVGIAGSPVNMTSFLIPRVREKVSTTQPAEIDTGFAVVNTGSKTATITATLYDQGGNPIAAGSFPLAPNTQKAAFVGSSFNFLNGEAAGRQYQYILFTSTQPTIAAAAIAFEGGNQTSFAVTPLS